MVLSNISIIIILVLESVILWCVLLLSYTYCYGISIIVNPDQKYKCLVSETFSSSYWRIAISIKISLVVVGNWVLQNPLSYGMFGKAPQKSQGCFIFSQCICCLCILFFHLYLLLFYGRSYTNNLMWNLL